MILFITNYYFYLLLIRMLQVFPFVAVSNEVFNEINMF